jgi:hypothetical protein
MGFRVTEADYLAESKRQQAIINSKTASAAAKQAAQLAWLKNQINYENFLIKDWTAQNTSEWKSFAYYCTQNSAYGNFTWNPFWVVVPPRLDVPYTVEDLKNQAIRNDVNGSLGHDDGETRTTNPLETYGEYVVRRINSVQATSSQLISYRKELISGAQVKISNYQAIIDSLGILGKPYKAVDFNKLEAGTIPPTTVAGNSDLVYNCSFPKETYFASNQFMYYNDGKSNVMHGNNAPTKISKSPLTELWQDSSKKIVGHKGMIIPNQTYFKTSETTKNPNNAITPQDKNGKTIDAFVDNVSYNNRTGGNYAFQFMYNPGSIQMSYMGTPDVDVGFEISGSEQFGLIAGVGVTQSTITFDILLNRSFDMTYIDPETKKLKKGFKVTDIYPAGSNLPTDSDLELIYHRGTMYDVEFLLRGLLGYAATTTLRSFISTSGIKQSKTADIGYLGAMPVELHLGESLRYLGIINGLGIQHVMFNERMVPTFSTLRIQFNRIPDFPTTI